MAASLTIDASIRGLRDLLPARRPRPQANSGSLSSARNMPISAHNCLSVAGSGGSKGRRARPISAHKVTHCVCVSGCGGVSIPSRFDSAKARSSQGVPRGSVRRFAVIENHRLHRRGKRIARGKRLDGGRDATDGHPAPRSDEASTCRGVS
jgi:hypothetical protein